MRPFAAPAQGLRGTKWEDLWHNIEVLLPVIRVVQWQRASGGKGSVRSSLLIAWSTNFMSQTFNDPRPHSRSPFAPFADRVLGQ